MITEYVRVTFKQRTFLGRQSRDGVGAKNGVRLVRITADGRDDLRITGLAPEAWEVPWANVASAVAIAGKVAAAPAAPEAAVAADDDEPTVPSTPKAKKAKLK